MQRIIFTVTTDLTYDQRMQRICNSMTANGWQVTLAGHKRKNSLPLKDQAYRQRRLFTFFEKDFLFYAFFNIRLFSWLLIQKTDIICAIDLDTILPCYFVSLIKNWRRVYDAHELFTEQIEIVTRPFIHKCWLSIEKFAVPKFTQGYTVNQFIVDELHRRYGVNYSTVMNLPLKEFVQPAIKKNFIIYQGAVNEGRSFETLIPAMQYVHGANLVVYGEGNFFSQTQNLIEQYNLGAKIELKGLVEPALLKRITPTAKIAVMLFEKTGMNQYHSLSNRFFDYIMAGIPQICVNYPEYKAINDKYQVAYMIDDTEPQTIADAITYLLNDDALYKHLQNNCFAARKILNWQNEEKKLLFFYKKLQ